MSLVTLGYDLWSGNRLESVFFPTFSMSYGRLGYPYSAKVSNKPLKRADIIYSRTFHPQTIYQKLTGYCCLARGSTEHQIASLDGQISSAYFFKEPDLAFQSPCD